MQEIEGHLGGISIHYGREVQPALCPNVSRICIFGSTKAQKYKRPPRAKDMNSNANTKEGHLQLGSSKVKG